MAKPVRGSRYLVEEGRPKIKTELKNFGGKKDFLFSVSV
jgi:hypothetical protein